MVITWILPAQCCKPAAGSFYFLQNRNLGIYYRIVNWKGQGSLALFIKCFLFFDASSFSSQDYNTCVKIYQMYKNHSILTKRRKACQPNGHQRALLKSASNVSVKLAQDKTRELNYPTFKIIHLEYPTSVI